MFLPMTREEMAALGWDRLDVILITGDGYIDAPSIGVAVVGKVLLAAGFRVGMIAQPDPHSGADIGRLGEPRLFWGVTAGCVDSLVANITASGRRRRRDDFTPGGCNDRRPNRATIVYSNMIRRHFKASVPIVLGGIEASLRRVTHYDYWSDSIRKSILFDAKADYLLYGMADRSVVELAGALQRGADPTSIRGLCFIARAKPVAGEALPDFADAATDKNVFTRMFRIFYRNQDPVSASRLFQLQDTRYWVQNPPALPMSTAELDAVYGLDFERELHPLERRRGPVKALETIRFSMTTHRGCYGECNYCAIGTHQGRAVQWRSIAALVAEAKGMTSHPDFKGIIHDAGGPTANMYAIECSRKAAQGVCVHRRCLFPKVCPELDLRHDRQIAMLEALRSVPGVRRVVVASGIRHDMVMADRQYGARYLEQIVRHHVSGQIKIAPEHSESAVLGLMGRPDVRTVPAFRRLFESLTRKAGKRQFLTYYMIAAHPGCRLEDMQRLRVYALKHLGCLPEQVQIFTPTPSTCSTLMYYTGRDPFTGRRCFVEKTVRGREDQKRRIRVTPKAWR